MMPHYLNSYTIICPRCGHEAPGKEYQPSCADECTCPKCDEFFVCEPEGEEEEE